MQQQGAPAILDVVDDIQRELRCRFGRASGRIPSCSAIRSSFKIFRGKAVQGVEAYHS